MDYSKKERLYGGIREAAKDRTIRKHYLSSLNIACKKPA